MESQSETTQTVFALKLPEVIMNGDVPAIASASVGTKSPIPPKTAEQKLTRKNELKAKSTLLLAIPDEHLLKFHGIKDAKTLWEAIKARFLEKIDTDDLERYGSQMAGGHAYHEGEKILKEDKEESEFQWQRNWHQGIRGIKMEMLQEGLYQWKLL
ncbi:hypothetical protein Tco_0969640 [Tanacetum coccineum]